MTRFVPDIEFLGKTWNEIKDAASSAKLLMLHARPQTSSSVSSAITSATFHRHLD